MTAPLAPNSTIRRVAKHALGPGPDKPRTTPRRPLARALAAALLGAVALTLMAWAPPTGAVERQAPTAGPTTTALDATPTSDVSDATPSTVPLVEQRPLPNDTTPSDPVEKGGALNNILPRPNSGHEPYYQGDRGTASQFAVLGAMILALVVILALVTRQSRRSKARWSAAAPMAGTPGVRESTSGAPPAATVSNEPAPDTPTPDAPAPNTPAPDDPTAAGPGSDAH